MLIAELCEASKIQERAAEAVDLAEHHPLEDTGLDGFVQSLHCRSIRRAQQNFVKLRTRVDGYEPRETFLQIQRVAAFMGASCSQDNPVTETPAIARGAREGGPWGGLPGPCGSARNHRHFRNHTGSL
jgi:hypothetical protein